MMTLCHHISSAQTGKGMEFFQSKNIDIPMTVTVNQNNSLDFS